MVGTVQVAREATLLSVYLPALSSLLQNNYQQSRANEFQGKKIDKNRASHIPSTPFLSLYSLKKVLHNCTSYWK